MAAKAKPVTRFYMVRGEHFEWARIWITDDGCFSCLSDFGNYGYWWGAPGCEFRKFLCHIQDDYLMSKLNSGERDEYDADATLKRWQRRICQLRREKELTRDEASKEWTLLENCSGLYSEFDLHEWYLTTKLNCHDEGPGVYRVPIQIQMFVKRLWPLFVVQLRAELAAEFTAELAEKLAQETTHG
jgi:hypothetical protein